MYNIEVILIDPFDKSVSKVDIKNDLNPIYKIMQCRLIDIIGIGGNNDLIIDDEGKLNADNKWFKLGGHAFAGRCLIASHNDEGLTISTKLSVNEVLEKIEFLENYSEEPYMEFIPIN